MSLKFNKEFIRYTFNRLKLPFKWEDDKLLNEMKSIGFKQVRNYVDSNGKLKQFAIRIGFDKSESSMVENYAIQFLFTDFNKDEVSDIVKNINMNSTGVSMHDYNDEDNNAITMLQIKDSTSYIDNNQVKFDEIMKSTDYWFRKLSFN